MMTSRGQNCIILTILTILIVVTFRVVALLPSHPATYAFTRLNKDSRPSLTKISLFGNNNNNNNNNKESTNELSKEQKMTQKAINVVVDALRKDKAAQIELGTLRKVNNILGYGSPSPGRYAVRFNASFQKSGKGMSAIPMPFGLGQTNQSEGRGTMVGQVKASVDAETGRVLECTVFRDLGYGRSFNLQCK